MKYAIVKIGAFQYTIEEGKEYEVPNFEGEVSKKVDIKDVLAVGDGDKVSFGKPNLDKATVQVEILDQGKGEKVQSRIFKAKSRYRRIRGLRKRVTKFKVLSIKA